jgi:2-dehydropantoate 2-reductase
MSKARPRILVLGAGIIGSLYAVKFALTGMDVTLIARGNRLSDINKNGLRYFEKGNESAVKMRAVESVADDDVYDYVFVAVRCDQMSEALESIRHNKSEVVVTLANAVSYDDWVDIIGERLLPGFPGAGGDIIGGVLHARMGGKTVFGEIGGKATARQDGLCKFFKAAALPYEVPQDILAFHLSHAATIAPNIHFYNEAGVVDLKTAKSKEVLHLLVRDMERFLHGLEGRRIPILDSKAKAASRLPEGLIVAIYTAMLSVKFTQDVLLGNHALSARAEAVMLYDAMNLFCEGEGQ